MKAIQHYYIKLLIFAGSLLGFSTCIEPYQIRGIDSTPDYLVINGFLDIQHDSASVSLTHTVPLNSEAEPMKESGAVVQLTDNIGDTYSLVEFSPGLYAISNAAFQADRTYQLHIKTQNQKTYASGNIQLTSTPPIDSVTWENDQGYLTFYLYTHGATDDTRYYRWQVSEAWQYNAPYLAAYRLTKGTVHIKDAENSNYTCWGQEFPSTILINSTTRLNQNVVSKMKLLSIPPASIKLVNKYSLLVRQQSLTEQEYTYWSNVKKTTESVGGLSDPLPSEVHGNMSCLSNPDEPVIGYFTGGSIAELRIYLTFSELPAGIQAYRHPYCELDTLKIDKVPFASDQDLISTISPPGAIDSISGYTYSSTDCMDCRTFGGTTKKPSFWKD
jgi:hypothetical protein